ncbi:general stress protein [Sphingomonas sp. DBB INV C78]|uniref:pyridoxamine 5'-phosphate oxidase family protein n=1 Tax=Sphingomonas sp. DBB INV C78 TaxID=3349434 RepID=UPI0036D3EB21
MPSEAEIEARFWKDLKASPFLMIGLVGAADAHAQPMTAFFDDDHGPIYFFTSRDNNLVSKLTQSHHAIANYVAKDHDLFASVHGHLNVETNAAVIDHFWNSRIASWYEGGRDDPKLALLRLDTERAEIWLGASSFGAAIKRLLGRDPKADYAGKVAEVQL